mmetsp:Transcript_16687/g.33905  ORF Transcript_16687/g.33905 Transcript_16687/m.33905 type:complete len:102 (-) Transcript_16687:1054-1359(-)
MNQMQLCYAGGYKKRLEGEGERVSNTQMQSIEFKCESDTDLEHEKNFQTSFSLHDGLPEDAPFLTIFAFSLFKWISEVIRLLSLSPSLSLFVDHPFLFLWR